MALIDRAARLIKADVHAVLDRIEEPEQVLRLAIREMEEELAGHEKAQKLARLRLTEIEARMRSADDRIGALDRELDLCFEQSREDLARAMVTRKLAALSARGRLHDEAGRLRERLTRLDEALAEAATLVDSYRQKADALRSDEPATAGSAERIAAADVEIALLRERQARGLS